MLTATFRTDIHVINIHFVVRCEPRRKKGDDDNDDDDGGGD